MDDVHRQLYTRSVENYTAIETTMNSFFQNGGWRGVVPSNEVLNLVGRIELLYPHIGITEHRQAVKKWLGVCRNYLQDIGIKPANSDLRQFVDDRGKPSKLISLMEYEQI